MTSWQLGLLVAAAFSAGTLDAVAGGGGLISLPALLAVGLPPHVALGTNKGQSIWGTAAALFTFWRAGRIAPRFMALMFPLAVLGACLGASLVLLLSPATLRPVVVVLLAVAAVAVWARAPIGNGDASPPPPLRFGVVVVATLLAVYDGFFGPGTGTFLIVALALLGRFSLPAAAANAKVVNLGSNLAALAIFAYHGDVRWAIALPMAGAQILGGRLGAKIAMRGGARLVRIGVIAVATALMIKVGYQAFCAL
ncbi:MAG: TSUP family transporter [Kofleriaceae bacterium]|nr:TSUP family transporter [Kofleriaceae bacterium]